MRGTKIGKTEGMTKRGEKKQEKREETTRLVKSKSGGRGVFHDQGHKSAK
jgi:hypothetical protein